MMMNASRAALLVVDMQERLVPAMADAGRLVRNAEVVARAAARLNVPVVASEQYPKGLGPTIPGLGNLLPGDTVLAKAEFSVMANAALRGRVASLGRRQVVVVGIEAHVCVMQTSLDLRTGGYETYVVADATSSRAEENRRAALARMATAGIHVVTTEMVVFEWLGRAGTDAFRELSALIR